MVQTVGRARAKDSRVFFMQPIQDTASKQQVRPVAYLPTQHMLLEVGLLAGVVA